MMLVRTLTIVLGTFAAAAWLAGAVIARTFPSLPRLNTGFSATYLAREIARDAARPPAVVFAGDSVLWGFGLPASDSAAAVLHAHGIAIENFAFEGGSPANTYALVRSLVAANVRPKLFVFNVNQKEFNPADSAYNTLHPGLSAVALTTLAPADRARLSSKGVTDTLDARIDRAISSVSPLYAMRADIRETLFGDIDAIHALDRAVKNASGATAREAAAHVPTPDRFEGTYALDPLTQSNVSVHFLQATLEVLREHRIPTLAVLTPTNHTLLHDYIDVPEYATNLRQTESLLARGGARMLDLDARFTAAEFFDNDHLTRAGNARLAALLEAQLPR